MSKASEYAKAREAWSGKNRPPSFEDKRPGNGYCTVIVGDSGDLVIVDDGGVPLCVVKAADVAKLAKWMLDVFGDANAAH